MWPWGLGAGSQATSGWAVGGTVVTVVGGWEEGLDGRMVVVRISLAGGGGGSSLWGSTVGRPEGLEGIGEQSHPTRDRL